jgi:hypothetical protein
MPWYTASGSIPSRIFFKASGSAESTETLSRSGPASTRDRAIFSGGVPLVLSVATSPASFAIRIISGRRGCIVDSPMVCKVIRGISRVTISPTSFSKSSIERYVAGRSMSLLPQ